MGRAGVGVSLRGRRGRCDSVTSAWGRLGEEYWDDAVNDSVTCGQGQAFGNGLLLLFSKTAIISFEDDSDVRHQRVGI